jgi:DHA3 family macrolide efflux protein-like MFS transporter
MQMHIENEKIKKPESKLLNLNFFLLWQGQLVSEIGDTVYGVALGFWILAFTGSTTLMGLLSAATVLPRIFLSPIAGTVIDRHNKKWILIIADSVRGISVTLLGIVAISGSIQTWMVLVVGIILGICSSFFNPAIDASIPDIVPKSKVIKANSSFSIMNTTINIVGKAIGGFLYQSIGAPILFIFNGSSFIFSAITELFVKIPDVHHENIKVNFIQDLKSGFVYIKNNNGIKHLYITVAFLNFFGSMSRILILPLFNNSSKLGAARFGIAMSFETVGVLLSLLALSMIDFKVINRFSAFILSGLVSAVSMIFLSITTYFPLIIFLLALNGFCVSITNALMQAGFQLSIPKNIRGKVFGFKRTMSSMLIPIAMALGGIFADILSVRLIIAICFGFNLVLFLYLASVKSVNKLINYEQ